MEYKLIVGSILLISAAIFLIWSYKIDIKEIKEAQKLANKKYDKYRDNSWK